MTRLKNDWFKMLYNLLIVIYYIRWLHNSDYFSGIKEENLGNQCQMRERKLFKFYTVAEY